MTICGVYKLNFKGTDQVYIGKGVDILHRFVVHKRKFLQGTHTNKMMLAYNTYGMPSLEILVECSKEELNSTEDEAIGIFDSVNRGFNTLFSSTDMPDGSSTPGELHGMSKHSNLKIQEVLHLLAGTDNLRLSDIAKIAEVSYKVVSHIAAGTSHTWLAEAFPEEYKMMLSKKYLRSTYSNSAKARGIVYPPIKSPTGEVYNIDHLTNFCKEHSLDPSTVIKLCRGKCKTHKRWTLVT